MSNSFVEQEDLRLYVPLSLLHSCSYMHVYIHTCTFIHVQKQAKNIMLSTNSQLRIILWKRDGRDWHSLWNTQPPAHHNQTIIKTHSTHSSHFEIRPYLSYQKVVAASANVAIAASSRSIMQLAVQLQPTLQHHSECYKLQLSQQNLNLKPLVLNNAPLYLHFIM